MSSDGSLRIILLLSSSFAENQSFSSLPQGSYGKNTSQNVHTLIVHELSSNPPLEYSLKIFSNCKVEYFLM